MHRIVSARSMSPNTVSRLLRGTPAEGRKPSEPERKDRRLYRHPLLHEKLQRRGEVHLLAVVRPELEGRLTLRPKCNAPLSFAATLGGEPEIQLVTV